LIAGENARKTRGIKAWLLNKAGFSRDVRSEILSYITVHNLQNEVRLVGFLERVDELYEQLDILCFASYLNSAGRPVFEAAFYGVPSIVAVTDPLPDSVVHEVTGLAIPRPEPILIADALQRLAEDEPLRLRLGLAAWEWAHKNFSIENSASEMLKVYQGLV
jgi:glycosyltransferase involved in cell wall biosynthesis